MKSCETSEDYFKSCDTKFFNDEEFSRYWEFKLKETPLINKCLEDIKDDKKNDDLIDLMFRLSESGDKQCVAIIGKNKEKLIKEEQHFTLKPKEGPETGFRYFEYYVEDPDFHLILSYSLI